MHCFKIFGFAKVAKIRTEKKKSFYTLPAFLTFHAEFVFVLKARALKSCTENDLQQHC